MPAGLQIFDASGNLVLDASHRLLRFIGVAILDGTNQSVYDADMAAGGWVTFQTETVIGFLSGGFVRPRFTFNNGTLSWTYAAMNNTTYDTYQKGIAFYGAY
jgi:hypothetical protein